MRLLVLLVVLQMSLTFPKVAAVEPYVNYTCPVSCSCHQINETIHRTTSWINCTVSHVSPHLSPLIRQISSTLTGSVLFTCPNEMQGHPESVLWDGAFQKVPPLKALLFDSCKFRTLSKNGFRDLGSLNQLIIRDATIDDLDPDLLTYLPHLDVLEITSSALTHLFPLCAAGALRVLNVSRNHISSVEHAGLHCSGESINKLETVDFSGNFLSEIPSWLSRNLPNLHSLNMANNHISQTDYTPFQTLPRLAVLDISNNSFTRLHFNFFRGVSNLQRLDMSTNKVSAFPRGLMSNLSALQHLDIEHMDLDDNVWTEISRQRNLTHLNLSHNRLTVINADMLNQLVKLEDCYLNNNQLTSLSSVAFAHQLNLVTLDLSFNEIEQIPPRLFSFQYGLESLSLHHNHLATVDFDSFSPMKELLRLDISHNSISELPHSALHALSKLTHFDVSSNNLITINSEVFSRTHQLTYLNVSFNNLTEVAVLNQLLKLKIIDLSHNRMSNLHSSFLMELRELTTIIMSHNDISVIPIKFFKGCESLQILDMSHNSIQTLDATTFSSAVRVQSINLTHNAITDIGYAFSGLKDLEVLDLSYNSIDNVLRGQFPHFIKHLNIRGNKIVLITAHAFKSLSRVRTVDLSSNKLTSVNRMDVEIAFNMGHSPVFNLEFNPFVCDCHLGWLKDWVSGALKDTLTIPSFYLSSGLRCSNPFYNAIQSLQELSRSEFLCSYSTYCEESCMCCDYACYCKYVCPPSCLCFIGDDSLQVHQVECSAANLTAVPKELPEGATDLRLDGNNIQVLHRHEFLALKHVQYLYLNGSQVREIQNNTFKGLKSVRLLFLQDNYLTSIYSVTFQGLDSLEQLFLQGNDIFSIDLQVFSVLPLLRAVNLQRNQLNSLPLDDMLAATNHTGTSGDRAYIYISGNPWNCDLHAACSILSFLQANPDFVADASSLECDNPTVSKKLHRSHSNSFLLLDLVPELCGMNQSNIINTTLQQLKELPPTSTELYALIAACLVLALAVSLLAASYAHRHFLQVFLFTRFGVRVSHARVSLEDRERPYDAYISYSNKDETFVTQQLIPRLESEDHKFQLCVRYRDFVLGACAAETVVRCVENCKRTILVVSNNYLNSEWCRFESQTAHQQFKTEGRNRLIFILMPNVSPAKVNDTLKVHFKASTYLRYDDPWFWEKLVFQMPDVRHRKECLSARLPCSRNPDYASRERRLSQQYQWQLYHQSPGCHIGSACETSLQDMYEIPMLDSPNVHYHLANTMLCSTHTNSAYHSSGCSDITSGCHHTSLHSNCYHQIPDHSKCYHQIPDHSKCYHDALSMSSSCNHNAGNGSCYHPVADSSKCYLHASGSDSCHNSVSDNIKGYPGSVVGSCYNHGSAAGSCYHPGSVAGSCYHPGSVAGSCYHAGSMTGSCCHYEEVGPRTATLDRTPHRQIGTPPPVPLIPREGFVPRQKPHTMDI